MTTPEAIRQIQTNEIKTALPDVVLRDFTESELPALKQLLDANFAFIVRGGINPDYIYRLTEEELAKQGSHDNHRMGIWKEDKLVGYFAIVTPEDATARNDVEISYIVDPAYGRQGIARAAVETVTESEIRKGHNVIAEVEDYNFASIRLLGKLGFQHSGHSHGRPLYSRDMDINEMSEEEIYHRLGL